jgi:adenylate cyclase
MEIERKPRLKKLVHRKQIITLLKDFAPLFGPEVSLAVSDEPDHLLGSHHPFPLNVAHALWEAAPEAEVVVTSHGTATPIYVEAQQVGLVMVTGPLPSPVQTQAALTALRRALESLANVALEKRAVAYEVLDRYREINLLYSLGETLATCLDMDELLQRVLTEASQIIQACQGAILLYGEEGEKDEERELFIAASTGLTEELETVIVKGRTLADEVARTGKPQIVSNVTDLTDGKQQIPLLAVPLLTHERRLGAILLVGKTQGDTFTAGDEKLLSALAWHAAIALENARLFDDVRQQRDEIATMKHYMDNIFASITSGVITIDVHDIITTFNQATERILLVPVQQAVNRPYHQVLGFLLTTPLPNLIEDVHQRHSTYVDQEIRPYLPQGKQLYLNVSLSTLQGSEGDTLGIAIVLDDVTEKHRYEHERALVSRYLPSGLVDQLPLDLAELELREERRVLTVLFADIRGFTRFSEINPPERVLDVLNNYLTLAEAAVRFNQGIVDKYVGDAIMALFNTPLLEEEDHAWQAVRMAWTLKEAVEAYHDYILPEERLFLGFGVCTGVVVVGNMGTADRMEYTAVGDTVNMAKRLQENARPGQILISHMTWEMVRDRVQVKPLPAMRLRGRQSFTRIYELAGLTDDGR